MKIEDIVESVAQQMFGPTVSEYSTSRTKVQVKTIELVCELLSENTGCTIRIINDVVFINNVPWSISYLLSEDGKYRWITAFGYHDSYHEAILQIVERIKAPENNP